VSTYHHRRLNGSSSSLHIFIYINKLKLYTCYFIFYHVDFLGFLYPNRDP